MVLANTGHCEIKAELGKLCTFLEAIILSYFAGNCSPWACLSTPAEAVLGCASSACIQSMAVASSYCTLKLGMQPRFSLTTVEEWRQELELNGLEIKEESKQSIKTAQERCYFAAKRLACLVEPKLTGY